MNTELNNDEQQLDEASRKVIRQALHDLSGPLNKANGFSEELRLIREDSLALIEQLPEGTEPDLRKALTEQLEDEMNHCLDRVQESLGKLDLAMQKLRSVSH